MKKTKLILFKMLFPHIVLIIFLVPISSAMLIYSFIQNTDSAITYLSYLISAYALTILCARIPSVFHRVKIIGRKNKYLNQYFGSPAIRVKFSLYSSFIINTIYAAMQLGLGLYNRSIWFFALSAYYCLLALTRFFLLKEMHKHREKRRLYSEYLTYRLCGIILFFINITLSVIAVYIVKQDRGFSYHYIVTIGMAAYTFTALTASIVNAVQCRKYHDLILSASKTINLAAALVSMLSLETAMLAAFGNENSRIFREIMTSSSGAAICTIVLSMAAHMIIYSTKQLRQLRKENLQDE
jgi:hypothetical protein